MENINSEDGLDRAVTTTKLRSPSQVSDSNTMDSFQDGGQQNMNSEQNDYTASLDSSHVNSESNNYPQNSGDGGVSSDSYARMNENIHPTQIPGFGMYGRGNYSMGDQHGAMSMPGSSEFSNQTSQYHGQYLPTHVRPGFPGGPKPGMNPMRPGMGTSSMGMMPPSYNPASTRLMSGQSISQQSGPTPTLNQLLQSPNSAQRYPNNYSEYGGSQKVPADMGSVAGYPMQQAWSPHQRGAINAFPQTQGAISGCQAFRNQVSTHFLHISCPSYLIHVTFSPPKCYTRLFAMFSFLCIRYVTHTLIFMHLSLCSFSRYTYLSIMCYHLLTICWYIL